MPQTHTTESQTELLLHLVDRLSGELYATKAGRPGYVENRRGEPIAGVDVIAEELAEIITTDEVSTALRTDWHRSRGLRNLFRRFADDAQIDLQGRLRSTPEGRQALVNIDRGNQNRIIDVAEGVLPPVQSFGIS